MSTEDSHSDEVGKFQIELPDGGVLTKDSMVEHIEHGPMYVDNITYSPHAKRVQLQSEMSPQGIKLTGEDIREQWNETISDDPFKLHENNPRTEMNGLHLPDSDLGIEVDVAISGDDEDNVEAVAMHAKDQIVRVMQAIEAGEVPEDMAGTGIDFDWDTILEDSDE
jgi:hypothetical protein